MGFCSGDGGGVPPMGSPNLCEGRKGRRGGKRLRVGNCANAWTGGEFLLGPEIGRNHHSQVDNFPMQCYHWHELG